MKIKILIFLMISFNGYFSVDGQSNIIVRFIHHFNNIIDWIFDDTITLTKPIKIVSNIDKSLIELSNNQKAESGFVDAYNNMIKNSKGIQQIMTFSLKHLFSAIEDIILKEKTFREKKSKVFFIKEPTKFPNGYNKKINSIFDLDDVLSQLNTPLVFNDDQKSHILKIIRRMQDNKEKIKIDPENRHRYTTQLFLSGPPGTGKTQLVYLLSEVTGLPVIILSSSQLILMGYESIRALQEILEEVKISSSILFIDEAELLLMNRDDLINLTEESYKQNPVSSGTRTEFSEILHRLLTTFLSITGNKKHNIFVASNQPMAFDKALSRRFLEFMVLSLPEYVDRIAMNYLNIFNISFSDLTLKDAAQLFVEYNKNLKENSAKSNKKSITGLSGSDIKVIISYLTQVNQPKKINGVPYYTATKSQLIQSIRDRLELYTLFGYNVSLDTAKLSIDLDNLETEYDKKEKALILKESEANLKYGAKAKEAIMKFLFSGKKVLSINNIKINGRAWKKNNQHDKMLEIVINNISNQFQDEKNLKTGIVVNYKKYNKFNYLNIIYKEQNSYKLDDKSIIVKYYNSKKDDFILGFIENKENKSNTTKKKYYKSYNNKNLITKSNNNKNDNIIDMMVINGEKIHMKKFKVGDDYIF